MNPKSEKQEQLERLEELYSAMLGEQAEKMTIEEVKEKIEKLKLEIRNEPKKQLLFG